MGNPSLLEWRISHEFKEDKKQEKLQALKGLRYYHNKINLPTQAHMGQEGPS